MFRPFKNLWCYGQTAKPNKYHPTKEWPHFLLISPGHLVTAVTMGKKTNKAPVLQLKLDKADAEPSEIKQAADGSDMPCTINGLFAAFSGGSVGYFFGFGEYY